MIQPSISAAFSRSREAIGYIAPSFVTTELGISSDHPLYSSLRRHIYEHPTNNFLYSGAANVIKKILRSGDPVAIWTDEYRERLESSGLPALGQQGELFFVTGQRKQEQISRLFDLAQKEKVKEIVVIDDTEGNLHAIHTFGQKQDIPVKLVLVHRKEQRQYEVLPSTLVKNVRKVERAVRRNTEREGGKTLWVFDFNRTLLNTDAFEKSVMKGAKKMMRRWRRGWDSNPR